MFRLRRFCIALNTMPESKQIMNVVEQVNF